ncbi:MAG: hypothetical protein EON58_07720, partial [Alphaproteobacteria bacterium]
MVRSLTITILRCQWLLQGFWDFYSQGVLLGKANWNSLVKNLVHRWESRTSTGALSTYGISSETSTYATGSASAVRGMKTGNSLSVNEKNGPTWATATRTDEYGYDEQRGYLNWWKDDGATPKTWAYDAAGNRNGGTYDALNRQTVYGTTASYSVDAAGNRLSRTSGGTTVDYAWDVLNRMTLVDTPTNYDSMYQYRADGLRAAQLRQVTGSAKRVTSYRYDGQMPVEEIYQVLATGGGTTTETTRWAAGPRGTERQEVTTATSGSSATTTDVSYPLYDAHGNAFAHIRRDSGNPGWYVPLTANDVRSFDPWGNVTSSPGFMAGAQGGAKQAYVGSLGHRKDDETGLVYMRARYYDPQVGRFTSEDPAMHGENW